MGRVSDDEVWQKGRTVEVVDMWTTVTGGVVSKALATDENMKRKMRLEYLQPVFSDLFIKV